MARGRVAASAVTFRRPVARCGDPVPRIAVYRFTSTVGDRATVEAISPERLIDFIELILTTVAT